LSPDAIIIQGPVDGAKYHGDNYSYPQIGRDLRLVVRDVAADTERLVAAVSSAGANGLAAAGVAGSGDSSASGGSPSEDVTHLYDKAFTGLSKSMFLLTQWKQSWDAAIARESVDDQNMAEAVAAAAQLAANTESV
jgi:hypothetical protein